MSYCYVFQGAHVSINARTEDDVDETLVISKVAKASGANYSYHKEQKRPMPAAEPVVCVFIISTTFGRDTVNRILCTLGNQ